MKKLSISILSIATVALVSWTSYNAFSNKAEAVSYTLNAEQTKLAWVGKYVSDGHTHSGTVAVKSGNMKFEGGKFVSGEFTVDMNSILNEDLPEGKNAYLVGHLKSGDFFNVEKFPSVVVKVNEVKENEIKATLNVLGTDIPATMPVKITRGKDGISAAGKFEIDFAATNMNGFKAAPNNPADARVHPSIAFDLNLVMTK